MGSFAKPYSDKTYRMTYAWHAICYVVWVMKVAIPYWQGRVSPVFDVAGNVLLVDIADGREQARQNVALEASPPQARAAWLTATGVNVLICGAISSPLELAVSTSGIEVIGQTCGEVECVLAAFIRGELDEDVFRMPGCCGRGGSRRRFRGGRGRGGAQCWRNEWKGSDDNAPR